MKVAMEEELSSNENDVPELFQFLNKDDIDSIITNHALLKQDIDTDANSAIFGAILAFDEHEKATADMLAKSEKLGLVEIALEYKNVSTRVGDCVEKLRVLKELWPKIRLSFQKLKNVFLTCKVYLNKIQNLTRD